MAKENLGVKRICDSCAVKFYDFNKIPVVCPKCGHSFDPADLIAQESVLSPAQAAQPDERNAGLGGASAAGAGGAQAAAAMPADDADDETEAAEAEAEEISLDALVEGENANIDDDNVDAVDNRPAPLEDFGVDDVDGVDDEDDDENIDDDVTLIAEDDS